MIVIFISVITTTENKDRFVTNLSRVTEYAKKTNGCISYEYFINPTDSNRFAIYAEFNSEENFLLYRKSEIMQMITNDLIPFLIEKPKFKHIRSEVFEQN